MIPDSVLEALDALGAKASPRSWDWKQIFPAPWPQNKDSLRYAALAVNHLRPLLAALEPIISYYDGNEVSANTVREAYLPDARTALLTLAEDLAKLKEA